jgi:PAS domain S-box-containing protein
VTVRDESPVPPDNWSRVGAFRYLAREDRWEWSDEVAQMHGYESSAVTPTTELMLSHKHPDDKVTVADLMQQVCRHGGPFSSRHRIIDTHGVEHLVMVVGDRWYDGNTPAGISGFCVDITEQFNSDVQERLTEAVVAIGARQAVINQAIGMVMLRYGLSAESAFQLLSKLSQEANLKLRMIAERVVTDSEAREAVLDYMDQSRASIPAQRVKRFARSRAK